MRWPEEKENVRQVPRLYDIYKHQGIIENFEQLLENIFMPLFEVTLDPESHPQLHQFLAKVWPRLCVSQASNAGQHAPAGVPGPAQLPARWAECDPGALTMLYPGKPAACPLQHPPAVSSACRAGVLLQPLAVQYVYLCRVQLCRPWLCSS